MVQLTAMERKHFEEQGYLVKSGLIDPRVLNGVIQKIEEAVDRKARELKETGCITDAHEDAPVEQRWALVVRDMGGDQLRRSWDDDIIGPELFNLMQYPALLDVLEALIGPDIIATGMIAARPKIPGDKRTTVLWHQDSNYFGEDAAEHRIITVWVPLVDTDEENGCMIVIPGSHKWGYQAAEMDMEHHAYRPVEDPTLRGDVVHCPMKVGDVLMFSNLTMHRSGMNSSDHIRWSVDFRYLSPQVRFARLGQFLPGFVARSQSAPESVGTWQSWKSRIDGFQKATSQA